jgi:hypothetical protein
MARLVQICASSNDLFGLDDEGNVHQYDFNTKAWVTLAHGPRETRDVANDAGRDAAQARRRRGAA